MFPPIHAAEVAVATEAETAFVDKFTAVDTVGLGRDAVFGEDEVKASGSVW